MTRFLSVATLGVALAVTGCVQRVAGGPSGRPGLGTSWGETRDSPVRRTVFHRDDPERPAAVVVLYYDDREGVRAVTRGAALSGWRTDDGAVWAGDAIRVRLLDAWGAALPLARAGGRQHVEGREG